MTNSDSMVSASVHVREPGQQCVSGIVLATGRQYRIRVFMPAATGAVGAQDTEADYRHMTDPLSVPNPPELIAAGAPAFRSLATWHRVGLECYRALELEGSLT